MNYQNFALLVTTMGITTHVACAPQSAPEITLHSTYIPQDLEGACSTNPSTGSLELSDDVSDLRAIVTGADMEEPIEATGSLSSLTIEEIPTGTDRFLTLFGLNDVGAETWRGFTSELTVESGQDTQVDLVMAAKADLSCARTPLDQPRAFHTATRLTDGRILLVGGATSHSASGTCDACGTLTATPFAEIYDPTLGTFRRTVGSAGTSALNIARFFHTATLLPDGRVLIAGGTGEAEFVAVDAQSPFPIKPTLPIDTIEVFDPATELFIVVGPDPGGPRVFHATVMTGEENILITGGIPGVPTAGAHDLHNALNTTTLCEGTSLICTSGPAMNKPRAGHLAKHVQLITDDANVDRIVIVGGAVETGSVNGISGYQLESLDIGSAAFTMLDVTGMSDSRNVFFATGMQYVDFRFLVAGGLEREPDGTFRMAPNEDSASKALVYVYFADHQDDPNNPVPQPAGGIAIGVPAIGLDSTRFMASSAILLDKVFDAGTSSQKVFGRGVIAGGFTDLDLTPDAHFEIFSEDGITDQNLDAISQISVGGSPRALRQSRSGATATGLGDGTILISGGESDVSADRTPLQTAEIFADPIDPLMEAH